MTDSRSTTDSASTPGAGALKDPGLKDPGLKDIAIIGGGINGCGIARDAAGRGMSVLLCEQGDIGGATSSASTKLIHGGLRYLEYYEFRLVREALKEREVLLRAAPHIIHPLRFVLPHHEGLRPFWFLRLGLFLYDHLGGRRILPGTETLSLSNDYRGAALNPSFTKGFEYSDCWVEDSRLVALNALDAQERGAEIRVRTKCVAAVREDGAWTLTLEGEGGERATARARVLVNAAGPWVQEVLTGVTRSNSGERIRLVKGSHIVVDRMVDHDRCYIFQNTDGRITFAIPYEQDFTLIGTTDVDYKGDPGEVAITEDEVDYLLKAASGYFKTPVTRETLRWSYSGVRPLYDDGASSAQQATRDYVLSTDGDGRAKPLLLSVFGGKITTYRKLTEAALEKIRPALPAMGETWTEGRALPGGNFPVDGRAALAAQLRWSYRFLDEPLAARFARLYGTRARELLGDARSAADMGRSFGAGLTEREVTYLMRREFARRAEDVVWRRTKLGLRLTKAEIAELDDWMKDNAPRAADTAA